LWGGSVRGPPPRQTGAPSHKRACRSGTCPRAKPQPASHSDILSPCHKSGLTIAPRPPPPASPRNGTVGRFRTLRDSPTVCDLGIRKVATHHASRFPPLQTWGRSCRTSGPFLGCCPASSPSQKRQTGSVPGSGTKRARLPLQRPLVRRKRQAIIARRISMAIARDGTSCRRALNRVAS
jgi:hypothetical protein